MEVIIFSRKVADYLDNLTFQLFEKEYFGFEESAFQYVERLVRYIQSNITSPTTKASPPELNHRGNYYSSK